MPDSASQERTLAVIEQCEKILLATEGINHVASLPGLLADRRQRLQLRRRCSRA
jgi:hypothetical protein